MKFIQPFGRLVFANPSALGLTVDSGCYGRRWDPFYDSALTGSLGCWAVTRSSPHVVYGGYRGGLQLGVPKTTNGETAWVNRDLTDGQLQVVTRALTIHSRLKGRGAK